MSSTPHFCKTANNMQNKRIITQKSSNNLLILCVLAHFSYTLDAFDLNKSAFCVIISEKLYQST